MEWSGAHREAPEGCPHNSTLGGAQKWQSWTKEGLHDARHNALCITMSGGKY